MPVAGDIFNRGQEFGNTSFTTSDFMILRVSGGNETGEEYLVQQVAIQYNQPINRIFEIGSGKVYFAPGRSIGTCQVGKIIGSKNIESVFGPSAQGVWTTDANATGDKTITFLSKGGPNQGSRVKFIMKGAVIESYSSATDANGLIIQENVSIQFAALTFG